MFRRREVQKRWCSSRSEDTKWEIVGDVVFSPTQKASQELERRRERVRPALTLMDFKCFRPRCLVTCLARD
ncbi:hypothetical protein HanIR_Chr02g0082541 [Helianthus annuus]|nr:hypothetical protein HanIR_Chr02g0082541 [Helianthus annuus]